MSLRDKLASAFRLVNLVGPLRVFLSGFGLTGIPLIVSLVLIALVMIIIGSTGDPCNSISFISDIVSGDNTMLACSDFLILR